MNLKKNNPLPEENYVIRYIAPARIRRDENEKILGILPQAFRVRADKEDGLSVIWLEFFPGPQNQQIIAAVKKARTSKLRVAPKSVFAVGKVGDILSVCNKIIRSKKTRIVYWPTWDNPAHAEVKSLPVEDEQLLELLAAETWSKLIFNSAIP